MSETDDKYPQIHYANWAAKNVSKDRIPADSVKFWSEVLEYAGLHGNRYLQS